MFSFKSLSIFFITLKMSSGVHQARADFVQFSSPTQEELMYCVYFTAYSKFFFLFFV